MRADARLTNQSQHAARKQTHRASNKPRAIHTQETPALGAPGAQFTRSKAVIPCATSRLGLRLVGDRAKRRFSCSFDLDGQ
jgi:hypothetical protein